ncbi:hypothetical protein GH714_015657 [Hevea brasiliensis]|uniref:Reverse transcriptase zinc-binding domain-containing protein n=1 Tax=Hevea brasiliensis TaxID=3981 RepID=A0A6A6KBY2_HEVBR|nr:hypothetical protein GH714_015657 [Hevea brasiliensis]
MELGFYLGLPTVVGRNKAELFGYIKDKVWQRLHGWKRKLLSRARKEVLFKAVVQVVPNYTVSVFLFPLELCAALKRMINSFSWSDSGKRGIKWELWDFLCRNKGVGALNFRQIHEFHIALLGKQGWRLLTAPNALISQGGQLRRDSTNMYDIMGFVEELE